MWISNESGDFLQLVLYSFENDNVNYFGFPKKDPQDLNDAGYNSIVENFSSVTEIAENYQNGEVYFDGKERIYYIFKEMGVRLFVSYELNEINEAEKVNDYSDDCPQKNQKTLVTSFGKNPFRYIRDGIISLDKLDLFTRGQTLNPVEDDVITCPADVLTGESARRIRFDDNSFVKLNPSRSMLEADVASIILNDVQFDRFEGVGSNIDLISKHYVAIKKDDQNWELRLISRPNYPFYGGSLKIYVFKTNGKRRDVFVSKQLFFSDDAALTIEEQFSTSMYINNYPPIATSLMQFYCDNKIDITPTSLENSDTFSFQIKVGTMPGTILSLILGNLSLPEDSLENGLLLFRTLINLTHLTVPSKFDEEEQPSFFEIKKNISEKIEFIRKSFFNFKSKNEIMFLTGFEIINVVGATAYNLKFSKITLTRDERVTEMIISVPNIQSIAQIRCGTKVLLIDTSLEKYLEDQSGIIQQIARDSKLVDTNQLKLVIFQGFFDADYLSNESLRKYYDDWNPSDDNLVPIIFKKYDFFSSEGSALNKTIDQDLRIFAGSQSASTNLRFFTKKAAEAFYKKWVKNDTSDNSTRSESTLIKNYQKFASITKTTDNNWLLHCKIFPDPFAEIMVTEAKLKDTLKNSLNFNDSDDSLNQMPGDDAGESRLDSPSSLYGSISDSPFSSRRGSSDQSDQDEILSAPASIENTPQPVLYATTSQTDSGDDEGGTSEY